MMQLTNLRLALAGLLAGVLLIGGTSAIVNHKNSPSPSLAAPASSVPGYSGPLYDADGRLVGYSQQAGINSLPAPSVPLNEYGEPLPGSATRPYAGSASPGHAVAPTRSYAPQPTVRHHRSTGKSVAIVAGSAGVGSAIGAIAGGGKGAAIGALSGGGAGFVYDRLTHNK